MMNPVKSRVALVIPALNEEPVIGLTLDALPRGMFGWVVVADNGSTDRTGEVARERGAIVVRVEERGYGAACLQALAALPAEAEVVVFLQADGSEDASEAAQLAGPVLAGEADLVMGSRTMGTAEPGALLPHQEFGNWVATTLVRWLYGHRFMDLGPFRAIRVDCLRRLKMQERNYGWTIEMQVRALEEGLRIREIPVRYGRRVAGENKVSGNLKASLLAGWRILSTVLKLRARRTMRT